MVELDMRQNFMGQVSWQVLSLISFHPCFWKISAITARKNEEEFRTRLSCNYPHTPFRPIPRNLVDERDSIGNDCIYGRLASTDCAWTNLWMCCSTSPWLPSRESRCSIQGVANLELLCSVKEIRKWWRSAYSSDKNVELLLVVEAIYWIGSTTIFFRFLGIPTLVSSIWNELIKHILTRWTCKVTKMTNYDKAPVRPATTQEACNSNSHQ